MFIIFETVYEKLSNDIFETFDIVQHSTLFEKLYKQNWVAGERGFMGQPGFIYLFIFGGCSYMNIRFSNGGRGPC